MMQIRVMFISELSCTFFKQVMSKKAARDGQKCRQFWTRRHHVFIYEAQTVNIYNY